MKNFIYLLFIVMTWMSCKKSDSTESTDHNLSDDVALSADAQNLLDNLKNLQNSKVLLGHQATTIAGVGWRQWQKPDYSDFKEVSGKFPAFYGWELANRPDNADETYDYVTYDLTISEAIKARNRGGINSFSMHPYRLDNQQGSWNNTPGYVAKIIPGGSLHQQYKSSLDKYFTELSKLKTADGKAIPFIFRPYHEADGNWFWWGSTACTDQEYKQLFVFTINYLREKGLNNMLVCYAPQNFQNEAQYLSRYPGDEVVDIIGFDMYYKNSDPNDNIGTTDLNYIKKQLQVVSALAQQKGKVAAWAETGQKNITTYNAPGLLAELVDESGAMIAYIMFWANYADTEHYIPHENSSGIRKGSFRTLISQEKYLAEGEYTDLYK